MPRDPAACREHNLRQKQHEPPCEDRRMEVDQDRLADGPEHERPEVGRPESHDHDEPHQQAHADVERPPTHAGTRADVGAMCPGFNDVRDRDRIGGHAPDSLRESAWQAPQPRETLSPSAVIETRRASRPCPGSADSSGTHSGKRRLRAWTSGCTMTSERSAMATPHMLPMLN